jgi:hypothetical protein
MHTDLFWGLPRLLYNAHRGTYLPGGEAAEHDKAYSHKFSPEIKNTWNFHSTVPIRQPRVRPNTIIKVLSTILTEKFGDTM